MVDWSAAAESRMGKDSVWYFLIEPGKLSVLANAAAQAEATKEIEGRLVALVNDGRSVLVGFDFPYSYPAGLSGSSRKGCE